MTWWLNMIEKGAIQSAITSASVSYYMSGARALVPMFGYVQAWQIGALAGFASSLVSDGLHYLVKEELHLADKVNDIGAMGLGLVSSGFVFNGVLYLLYNRLPQDYGILAGMVTGAVTEYATSFLYNLLKSYSVLP